MFRSRPTVELEILARRHQIGVVQHANKRTRLTPAVRFVVGASFPNVEGLTVSRVLDLVRFGGGIRAALAFRASFAI